jgi:dephospho-CoA kinase
MPPKIKIGVTGGIGGGKTSFCNFLIQKGYIVLSADSLAKEILIRDKEVREKIIKNFGKETYTNGVLNNKYLAEKVFSNPESVKKINKIVHPKVISEIEINDA